MIAELVTGLVAGLAKANLAAAAVVLVVLAVRRPVRRMAGPSVAYALWLIVPLAMTASLLPLRVVVAPLPEAPVSTVLPATVQLLARARAVQHPEPGLVFAVVWGVGLLACLTACAIAQRVFLRRLGALLPIGGDGRQMKAQAVDFGPAVVGAFAPRIIVPQDFEARFAPEERRVILAHEATHLRRGDALVNALTVLGQCVCWFNPLMHLGAHVMRLDQELSCDAAVMARHPGARRIYAQAMVKTQMAGTSLAFGCYWPARGEHPLKERLVMLRAAPASRVRRRIGAVFALALAAGCGCAAWAVQSPVVQGPPLVAGDPRLANSGFVNYFDATSPVLIYGVVTHVDWLEPRTFVYLTDARGTVWAAMGGSPGKIDSTMRRRLDVGTRIVVRGYRAWDRSCRGGCVVSARAMTYPNGQPVFYANSK